MKKKEEENTFKKWLEQLKAFASGAWDSGARRGRTSW